MKTQVPQQLPVPILDPRCKRMHYKSRPMIPRSCTCTYNAKCWPHPMHCVIGGNKMWPIKLALSDTCIYSNLSFHYIYVLHLLWGIALISIVPSVSPASLLNRHLSSLYISLTLDLTPLLPLLSLDAYNSFGQSLSLSFPLSLSLPTYFHLSSVSSPFSISTCPPSMFPSLSTHTLISLSPIIIILL